MLLWNEYRVRHNNCHTHYQVYTLKRGNNVNKKLSIIIILDTTDTL